MLDRRWRKVLRDVWLHKARTGLVVCAIVVGIVGAGAVLDTWALLRGVTREEYLATNPPSATLRVDSIDAALLARVRALPSVAAATARRTVIATIRSRGTWRTAMLFSGSDLDGSAVGRIARVGGTWPVRDGALVIENSSMEFGEIAVGDTVLLQQGEHAVLSLPVAGVARDAGLAPGWMEHIVYAFVTPATLSQLGVPSAPNELRFVSRRDAFDREANRRVALEVQRIVEASGRRVLDVDVPVPGRHIHAAQMDSLLFTQGAFGLLALLLSAFLVVNLISAMLAGQTREIGVLKAIGASSRAVATMYLTMALGLGLLASAIALPIAAYVAYQYAAFSASLLNFDIAGQRIPVSMFALQLLVGVLLPVLAAAVPVWRGCSIPVADALRDVGVNTRSPARGTRVLHRARWFSRPVLLALRNSLRHPQRTALTVLTLALGGAAFIGALGLRSNIRDSVDVLYGDIMRFDITVRLDALHAVDSIETLVRSVPGVARAEAWGGARAAVMREGVLGTSFTITALPPSTTLVRFPVVHGAWLVATPEMAAGVPRNELVVSAPLAASDSAFLPGNTVMLVIDGKRDAWFVRGIVEAGPSPTAYSTRETLARVTGEHQLRTVILATTSRSAAGQSELLQRLRSNLEERGFGVANAQLIQANRAAIEDHLLMVAGFLLAMSQLTVVVGGLGLASTMSLSVLERTREIGVMRAIGASHPAILAIVQTEGLVIALLSWVLAIPIAIPVSALLSRAFGRIMLPVPERWTADGAGVLIWLALVTVVSLLACAWPARRATRITTAAALAYE